MLKITTPCSSANIGPGFDCLGIAFNIYNTFTFEKSEKLRFEGFAEKYCNETNLVYKSYKTAMEKLGKTAEPLKIGFCGEVPTARGLGSSSTCISAGVAAAFELSGAKYTKQDVAKIASEIEGHPDNVSACVYGGFVASAIYADDDGEVLAVENFKIDDGFKFYALIPDFELSTKQSREVLPKAVSMTAAKKNLANMPLLIKALENGNETLLKFASADWLHQPYRGGIINGFFQIQEETSKLGASMFLSGAGSTILIVSKKEIKADLQKIVSVLENEWQVKPIKVDYDGLKITDK